MNQDLLRHARAAWPSVLLCLNNCRRVTMALISLENRARQPHIMKSLDLSKQMLWPQKYNVENLRLISNPKKANRHSLAKRRNLLTCNGSTCHSSILTSLMSVISVTSEQASTLTEALGQSKRINNKPAAKAAGSRMQILKHRIYSKD